MNTQYHSLSSARHFGDYIQYLLIGLLLVSISACSPSSNTENDSELVISLTDAEGDFLSYTVDVVSLKMTRANGAEVETLPLTTRLDFAQYVEVTEFLTAASVPSGRYSGAQITLDYSNANITVQDENGDAISANAVDADGNAISQISVDISLNGGSEFVIAPGVPAHFTLDFDLDASNEITINGTDASVTVNPVLVADTLLEDPKPHRLRGLLNNVDETAQQFTVLMRPFRHTQQAFGELLVQVDENSVYEIDGQNVSNDTGLAQLARLDANSPIIVMGELQLVDEQRQFIASEIYAGSSVPWGDKDIVRGHVVARNGNTLSLRGASIILADNSFRFNDSIQVELNAETQVVKQADNNGSFTGDDISVGQRITVLGNFRDTSNPDVLDADLVRMRFTQLSGTITSVSPLNIDLQRIDRRRASIFDFSGTGIDAANDADINAYEIATGNLDLSRLALGEAIKVRGFVRPFGLAPEDFTARTLVDVHNVTANLVVGYGEGSAQAVSSIDANGLQLSLTDAGRLHHISQAGVITDLNTLDAMPLITPKENGRGLFMISRGFGTRLYHSYNEFQLALADALANDRRLMSVHAQGKFDRDLNVISAKQINVRLQR